MVNVMRSRAPIFGSSVEEEHDEEDVERSYSTIRDAESEADDAEWTPRKVEDRLAEMIRVIQWTGRRAGPGSKSGFWPESYGVFQDSVGNIQRDYPPEKTGRAKLQATSIQVERAEEAMMWPIRHVHDGNARAVLMIWLRAKAERRAWSKLVKRAGIALSTAKRLRSRAVFQIIIGLKDAGVVVR